MRMFIALYSFACRILRKRFTFSNCSMEMLDNLLSLWPYNSNFVRKEPITVVTALMCTQLLFHLCTPILLCYVCVWCWIPVNYFMETTTCLGNLVHIYVLGQNFSFIIKRICVIEVDMYGISLKFTRNLINFVRNLTLQVKFYVVYVRFLWYIWKLYSNRRNSRPILRKVNRLWQIFYGIYTWFSVIYRDIVQNADEFT